MGNKVNYTCAINFVNLFHTPRILKKRGRIQKNGVAILSDEFSWLHFIMLSQNAHYALILDHL